MCDLRRICRRQYEHPSSAICYWPEMCLSHVYIVLEPVGYTLNVRWWFVLWVMWFDDRRLFGVPDEIMDVTRSFDRYLGRPQNVDDDHDILAERFHEDVIDRWWHQVKEIMKRKVIGTMGTTQTRNQVLYSRTNDMTRKINVRLAHRRNLCSGKKDQVA